MRLLSLLILFFPFTIIVFSQPNPRHLEEVAYDKSRDRLILFGGAEFSNGKLEEPSMVYEWDGSTWTRFDASGPCGRRGHGWVFDEDRKETLLIGGVCEGRINKDSAVFDLWSWDGRAWIQHNSQCPVKEPEAVYDPVNKRILVYGASNNKTAINDNTASVFELWEYKSNIWKMLTADGPAIVSSRMISFDSERSILVIPVFDQKKMIVWEWMANSWEKIFCDTESPVYRTRFAIAYSSVEKRVMLFGGLSEKREQLGDFWKWDGKKWESIRTKEGPSVRNSHHFVFLKDKLILYGGSVPKLPPANGIEPGNEMWSWQKGFWKRLK